MAKIKILQADPRRRTRDRATPPDVPRLIARSAEDRRRLLAEALRHEAVRRHAEARATDGPAGRASPPGLDVRQVAALLAAEALLTRPAAPAAAGDQAAVPRHAGVDPASASASALPSRAGLSPRLVQTLDRLLQGDSEKQVAVRMGISRHTVHAHVKKLYRHFGVNARPELLALFVSRP